jgi:uncharacterized membrane protein YbhN (UPF0104 family)
MKKILLSIISAGITAFLLYYVISQNRGTEWRQILIGLNASLITIYLGLYGLGLLFRTIRYHLLLKSSKTPVLPSFGNLLLVTSVRNMLVDFLPARAGSLSYIVLLNKAFKVDLSPCLTSFTYAFLFDLLAMAPLLAGAILAEMLLSQKNYPWLWALALIILVVALALIFSLNRLMELFSRWYDRTAPKRPNSSWLKKVDPYVRNLGQSISTIQQAHIFWPTMGLSCLIRAIKYLYLYVLLSAVLEALAGHWVQLPFWVVLLGLVASEASAGLPVSGLMGFGLYEGVLGAVLSTQGIPPSQAVLVSFAMHFFTQIVDYSLGGAALLYIFLRIGLKKKA